MPLVIVGPQIARDPAGYAEMIVTALPDLAEMLGWAMLVPLAVLPFAWMRHRRIVRREEVGLG